MQKLSKTAVLFSFLFLSAVTLSAQRYDTQKKIKRYYVSVYNETSVTKGILFEVTDSAIVMLSNTEYEKYKQRKDYKLTTVHYSNIDMIKVARVGRFIKCLGLGALFGTGIGLGIGEAGANNIDPSSDPETS